MSFTDMIPIRIYITCRMHTHTCMHLYSLYTYPCDLYTHADHCRSISISCSIMLYIYHIIIFDTCRSPRFSNASPLRQFRMPGRWGSCHGDFLVAAECGNLPSRLALEISWNMEYLPDIYWVYVLNCVEDDWNRWSICFELYWSKCIIWCITWRIRSTVPSSEDCNFVMPLEHIHWWKVFMEIRLA